jgi:hypothetical protein
MAVPSPRGVRSRAQATGGLQQWRVGKRRIITVTENDLFTEWPRLDRSPQSDGTVISPMW